MLRILSQKEEKQLNKEELLEYYAQLKDYVQNRNLTNTTPGALTIAPKLKGITNKISDKLTRILCRSKVEIVSDGQENIPKGPAIFAGLHQGILDGFVWIPHMPRHCVILHGASVRTILKIIQLNTGLILVDKESKGNRQNAKLDMMKLLWGGHSIVYFPEGTWNLSPNKLHLPMSYGFLDIARKTNSAVVPVVMEYSYDSTKDIEHINKIHIRFGKPIYVDVLDNLETKLIEYEEAVSTIRWELIEEKGIFPRKNVTNWDYINYLKGNLRNLKLGGIDLDSERRHILGAEDDFYVFHHINDFSFNNKGELL